MVDTATVASVSAAIGVIVGAFGGVSGVVGWRRFRHDVKRNHWQDIQASYEKQISSLEKRGEQEKANRLREEYEGQQEAWRATQAIKELAPTSISEDKTPTLKPDEIERLKELLITAQPLNAAALSADDYSARGNALHEDKRYEEALLALDRAVDMEPENPAAHYNRGIILRDLGRLDEALVEYDRVLEIDFTLNLAHGNRGVILTELGRFDEALAAAVQALELKPNDTQGLNNRISTLIHLTRYEEALEYSDAALGIYPNLTSIMYNKACALSKLERGESALESLGKVIEADQQYREMARTEADFMFLRDHPDFGPRFRELVGE